MTRLKQIDPATAEGRAKELLDAVRGKMGMVPNLTRVMANSPATLEAYLGFSGALAEGQLDPQLRERFSIAVGSANGCDYCLSAHMLLGKKAGLSDAELTAARSGESADEKASAALKFATALVCGQGHVSDEEIAELRRVGFDDGDITEMVANVALNIFTNYFNHVAETEVDFPLVKAAAS